MTSPTASAVRMYFWVISNVRWPARCWIATGSSPRMAIHVKPVPRRSWKRRRLRVSSVKVKRFAFDAGRLQVFAGVRGLPFLFAHLDDGPFALGFGVHGAEQREQHGLDRETPHALLPVFVCLMRPVLHS